MTIRFIDRQTGEIHQETPPGEGFLRFLYHNPFGKLTLNTLVKRKGISALYGRMMNRPSSRERIQGFVDQLGIDMSESVKSVEEFTSFNDFFYRKLKPEARPIGEGFVSPGDGKLIAFDNVADVGKFFVKGIPFTLAKFLADPALTQRFDTARMMILRLAPNDYHRFHFPYAGTPAPAVPIQGRYLSVSPYALESNFARVFTENKRERVALDTPDKGQVLLCPVGATMVGTIIETYTPNQPVQKGDEMGYFAFGGSSILLLAERAHLTIDEDILTNTRNRMETFVKMGEKIGS